MGTTMNDRPTKRRPRRLVLAGALTLVIAAIGLTIFRPSFFPATPSIPAVLGGVLPPGDELELQKMQPYGWDASMAVGTRFTDGFSFLVISPSAKGPLRILSVTPLMDDGKTLKVVGVLARIIPDMLPPNYETGWFQSSPGFPPTDHDAKGGVDPTGLVVRVPTSTDNQEVELLVGYEVVAQGKSNRAGIRIRYEYLDRTHEVVVPSHLSICAPAQIKCSPK